MKTKHRQSTYTHWHVLLANPTNPMPEPKRRHQLTRMYLGLESLEKSERPSRDDWAVCSDAVNLMETFILSGVVEDSGGLLMDGITALAKAGKRSLQGGAIRLDGPGIAAKRRLTQTGAGVIQSTNQTGGSTACLAASRTGCHYPPHQQRSHHE